MPGLQRRAAVAGSGGLRWGDAAGGGVSLVTAAAARRVGLLAEPDFRRLWLIGVVVFAVRWLEMLAVGVFVYRHTGSPFTVALMTMLRMLPMGLFGAVIGAAAERMERRTALVASVVSMGLISGSLFLLAATGRLQIWHLAIASFFGGIGWATDNPVRRTLIGDVVGPSNMGAAMAIDVGANNASRMLGPTLGGLLLANVGIAGVFSVSVAAYLVAIVAALRVGYRGQAVAAGSANVLVRMLEGFSLARRDPRLVGILVITVIYNMFGWPFTSMIPVIGQDHLHLGASGIGVLASMDGVGAFCGALALAFFARPPFYRRIYIGGTLGYLLILTGFAAAPSPLFAGLALLSTGLCNAGFSIMQATLVYLAAPPEMRSRIYGVLSVCIGVGLVGFVHIGILAGLIGAPRATVATGVEGLIVLLLTRRLWRTAGSAPHPGPLPAGGERETSGAAILPRPAERGEGRGEGQAVPTHRL
jgi:MFS family permease